MFVKPTNISEIGIAHFSHLKYKGNYPILREMKNICEIFNCQNLI